MRLVVEVLPVPGDGAEDVVVDAEGRVYTGTADGSVFRMDPAGRRVDRVGDTGGRPLGLELLADGRLLVCDARRGLLALDPADGAVEELVGAVHGRPMRFTNNAAVHSDGSIFFSDSSRVYGIDHWQAEMVENTGTGRLLRRGPEGRVEVLVDGLRFANGVSIAADESFVVVAETAGRSLLRHWLTGPRAGSTDPWLEDLPGYPDNVSRGSDGLTWVTLASPTDPVVERIMAGPMLLRRLAWRLPERIRPKEKRSAHVLAVDAEGRVVHDLDLDASTYHMVTGVREVDGTLWLGSLNEPAVARVRLG